MGEHIYAEIEMDGGSYPYRIQLLEGTVMVYGCDCADELDDPLKLVQLRDELNKLLERRGLA